jgi:hypothetical protein
MDPLVVSRGPGESVHLVLGNLSPGAYPEGRARQALEFSDVDGLECYGCLRHDVRPFLGIFPGLDKSRFLLTKLAELLHS